MKNKFQAFVKIALVVVGICLICLLFMRACGGPRDDMPNVPSGSNVTDNGEPSNSGDSGVQDGNTGKPEPDAGTQDQNPSASSEPGIDDYYPVDNPDATVIAQGKCRNDSIATYQYDSQGNTISLGVALAKDCEYIYLNPVCSEASPASKIGFFVSTSRVSVNMSDTQFASSDSPKNVNAANVILSADNGRDYDLMVPAAFTSEKEYGLRWKNNPMSDGKSDTGTQIYLRAIRLSDGMIVASCRADILYDSKSDLYMIGTISSNDVSDTKDLTEDERNAIVSDAFDFIYSAERGPGLTESQTSWSRSVRAYVEKLEAPYFSRMYDKDNAPVHARSFSKCDVYAVSIPVPGPGSITCYYAPALQLQGMSNPYAPGEKNLNLELFGYDAFNSAMLKILTKID